MGLEQQTSTVFNMSQQKVRKREQEMKSNVSKVFIVNNQTVVTPRLKVKANV